MTQIFFPVLFALLIWWISTGLILRVIARSPTTYPLALTISFGILAAALLTLFRAGRQEALDAYTTFAAVVAVWGFVEMTFLTGYVTGPRTSHLPAGASGWQRFRFATETILFHELLLVAMAGAIMMTAGIDNWLAWGTYAVLWVMRLSSKINLFLGVPSLNADLLPRQLAHLGSYFRQRSTNGLLPFSIAGSALAAVLLFAHAISTDAGPYAVTAHMLLATLIALALLEHIFMLLPFRVATLWGRTEQDGGQDVLSVVAASAPPAEAKAAASPINGIRSLGGLQ